MMFHLDYEQQSLFDTVSRYVSGYADGRAARRAIDSDDVYDPALWAGLVGLGVAAVATPVEHGGVGLGLLDLAVAAEALGAQAAPGPFLGHSLATLALIYAGSEAQKAQWLPLLAAGTVLGTVALEETGGGVLPADWTADIVDGRLIGSKINVAHAPAADLVVVGCRDGKLALATGPVRGEATAVDVVDRTRRLWSVDFAGAPAQWLDVGGPTASDKLCDAALILLAADGVGGANRLLDMAVEHVKTREQFGGPIGRFQGIKHQLANLLCAVEPVRSLCWYAAYVFDEDGDQRQRIAALAKAHVSDVYMQTGRDVVQLHGGLGYTWDYDVQIWLKRAVFDYALMGGPDVHRERAAALAGW